MSIKQLISKFSKNWVAKLFCFALAIMLYLLHQASVVEKKTFVVPLTVVQDGNVALTNSKIDRNVSIIVRTSPDNINMIQPSEITASLDLTSITKYGELTVPVKITVSDKLLTMDPLEVQVKPEQITVNLEEKVLKYVEVKPSIVESVAHGYVIDKVTCNPPYIEILGPKSVIEQTEFVYTKRIPASNASSSFTADTTYYNVNKLLEVPNKGPYKVTVAVVPDIMVRQFNNVPIEISGLSDKLILESVLPSITLSLEGTVPYLETYNLPKSAALISLENISEPGIYDVPVTTRLPGVITVKSKSLESVKIRIGRNGDIASELDNSENVDITEDSEIELNSLEKSEDSDESDEKKEDLEKN